MAGRHRTTLGRWCRLGRTPEPGWHRHWHRHRRRGCQWAAVWLCTGLEPRCTAPTPPRAHGTDLQWRPRNRQWRLATSAAGIPQRRLPVGPIFTTGTTAATSVDACLSSPRLWWRVRSPWPPVGAHHGPKLECWSLGLRVLRPPVQCMGVRCCCLSAAWPPLPGGRRRRQPWWTSHCSRCLELFCGAPGSAPPHSARTQPHVLPRCPLSLGSGTGPTPGVGPGSPRRIPWFSTS